MSAGKRFGKLAGPLTNNGYLVVPTHDGEKRPIPTGWQEYRLGKGDIKQYPDAGVGILMGLNVIAIDNDVKHPELAPQCDKLIVERCGPAPRREGQKPKSAYLYAVSEPMTHAGTRKYQLPGDAVDDPNYKPHGAEALGKGQHLASYGRHPNGQEYTWNGGGEPLVTPVKDLTVVMPAQVHDLIGALDELIASFPGAQLHGKLANEVREHAAREPHEPNAEQRAKNPTVFRSALAYLPNNDEPGDIFTTIVYAVKAALGAEGLPDILAWSVKSKKHDAGYTTFRFNAARPTELGAGTIFYLALQAGWKWPDVATDDAIQQRISELARLSPIEYDRIRAAEAEKLGGIRRATLDAEVAAKRQKSGGHGPGISFADPDPWQSPVNGAELLDELYKMTKRYLVLSDHSAIAIALWALHTWATDAFHVSPYLLIRSPLARCGKSTLMMVLEPLVRRPLIATSATSAAVFRAIEAYQPTLILDEADLWLKSSEELRAILNGGHTRRSAYVLRTVGDDHEPRRFATFCPKAFAGIGKLAVTLEDRSIVIMMRRKRAADEVERLRLDKFDESVDELNSRCLRWATDNLAAIEKADPEMPAIANDRAADNWRQLLKVADLAGGKWPKLARDAAKGVAKQEANDATGEQLLADVRRIFKKLNDGKKPEERIDRIRSSLLAGELGAMEEKPWAEWGQPPKKISMNQVARLLDEFAINPRTILFATKPKEDRAKGYYLNQFTDAFLRYLPDRDPEEEADEEAGKQAGNGTSAPSPDDKETF